MPPVSKELNEKMSVAIGNLRTFLKAMISGDPLFQGFTFISWLIFLHSRQEQIEKILIMKNKQWITEHFTSQQKFQAT